MNPSATPHTKQNPSTRQELYNSNPLTCGVTIARAYHRAGLRVFPLPQGTKQPAFKWGRLRKVNLPESSPDGLGLVDIVQRFNGAVNLAILTGRPSLNLLVLDCDDMAAFDHIAAQLRQRGIPVRGAYTRRGAHIYLRISEGEVTTAHAAGIDIKSAGGYVIAPPSIHPEGAAYRFIDGTFEAGAVHIPTVSIEHIAGLTDSKERPIPLTLYRRGWQLKASTIDFLSRGAAEGERNNRLFEAAVDYHRKGYSLDRAYTDLGGAAQRSGLPQHEIDNTIRSAYNRSQSPAETAPSPSTVAVLGAALATCRAAGIPSRRLKSRAAILVAMWNISHYRGQSPARFTASWRLISEKAAIAKRSTIRQALVELERAGLIVRVGSERHGTTPSFPGSVVVPPNPEPRNPAQAAYWRMVWQPTPPGGEFGSSGTQVVGTKLSTVPNSATHWECPLLGYLSTVSGDSFTRAGLIAAGIPPTQVDNWLRRTPAVRKVARGVYQLDGGAQRHEDALHEAVELKRLKLVAAHYAERQKWIAQDIEKALHAAARRRADRDDLPVAVGAEPRHPPKQAISEAPRYGHSGIPLKTPEIGVFEGVEGESPPDRSIHNPFGSSRKGA